jgi:ATP-binding cassette subfamily B protein
MDRGLIVRRLNRFMRPLFGVMAFSILMRVLNLLAATALVAIAAGVVGRFVANPINAELWGGVGLLFGTAMGLGFFHYMEQYTGHYIAFRLLALLRNQFYDRMEPLAPAGFAELRSGDAIARAINDVERIEPYYAHTVAPAFAAVIVPAILLAILAGFHPWLALALFPFLFAMAVPVPWIVDRLGRKASYQARTMLGEVNAHLTDSLQGLRETAMFGYGARRRKEIWAHGAGMRKAQDRLIGADAVQRGLTEMMIVGAAIAVLATGLQLVTRDQLDALLELPIVMAITLTSFTSVIGLTNVINDFNTAMISAERVYSLLDQEPVVKTEATDRPEIGSGLSFAGVGFDYRPEPNGQKRVLDGLDLNVLPGQKVALVGASGAGKSTIVNLLVRFWDSQSGRISIGDRDIKQMDIEHLRDQVSVVSQRTYLFNTTIGENIRLGRPEATNEELTTAASRAGLGDFIESLPEGLDAPVGEMGAKLSGGQRQRIAIARALLKDAPILILDEATSNLDVETEQAVKRDIDQLMAGRTTLQIAHRLSSVVDADNILVLHEGKIREQGRHDALIEQNGIYARLFELQQDEIDEIMGAGPAAAGA